MSTTQPVGFRRLNSSASSCMATPGAGHKDVKLVLPDFGKDLSRGRRATYHKASFGEHFMPKRENARIRAE